MFRYVFVDKITINLFPNKIGFVIQRIFEKNSMITALLNKKTDWSLVTIIIIINNKNECFYFKFVRQNNLKLLLCCFKINLFN